MLKTSHCSPDYACVWRQRIKTQMLHLPEQIRTAVIQPKLFQKSTKM